MDSVIPTAKPKRKPRVNAACDFCRMRKLGCDAAKPKCENCASHQRVCTYTARVQKERPSYAKIDALKEENAKLRELLEEQQARTTSSQVRVQDEGRQVDGSPIWSLDRSIDVATSDGREETQSQTELALESGSLGLQNTRFHATTSPRLQIAHHAWNASNDPVIDAAHKAQLLGQAAKERQLESINFRSEKLRFADIDSELGMKLISVFWTHQHTRGSIVYRPCFMRDMAKDGPYYSSLLLNAILLTASKGVPQLDGTDNGHRGLLFRRKIEQELYDPDTQLLCKSRITTIQALLLFSDALFSWFDDRSLSWHYLGIAINMIVDLGIHSQNTKSVFGVPYSPEDLEVRRRVFWAAFVLDKIQSISQGRSSRLREGDCTTPIVFADEYEELEPFDAAGYAGWAEADGQPIYGVSTFEWMCKLCIIADRILGTVYAESSHEMNPEALLRSQSSLHGELQRWRESLPAHLSIKMSPGGNLDRMNGCVALPHTTCLILMSHALTILLHRPFSTDGHLRALNSPFISASICADAASKIHVLLRWYKRYYSIRAPPFFLSYATYASATIHARLVARSPFCIIARRCLTTCLGLLTAHEDSCRAPRRALSTLLGLLTRLEIEVGDLSVYEGASMRTLREIDDYVLVERASVTSSSAHPGDNAVEESSSLDDGFDPGLPDALSDFDPLVGFDVS